MPIHEYRCQSCGEEFEVIQRYSDRPLRVCKKCGGPLEKLLSRTAFVLKGSGWYADGYSAGKGASAAKSGQESGAKSPAASPKTATGGGGKSGGSD